MESGPGDAGARRQKRKEPRAGLRGGPQATEHPPSPAHNKGAAELAKRAYLAKNAGEGGTHGRLNAHADPMGGMGAPHSSEGAQWSEQHARLLGGGIQLAGRRTARDASKTSWQNVGSTRCVEGQLAGRWQHDLHRAASLPPIVSMTTGVHQNVTGWNQPPFPGVLSTPKGL